MPLALPPIIAPHTNSSLSCHPLVHIPLAFLLSLDSVCSVTQPSVAPSSVSFSLNSLSFSSSPQSFGCGITLVSPHFNYHILILYYLLIVLLFCILSWISVFLSTQLLTFHWSAHLALQPRQLWKESSWVTPHKFGPSSRILAGLVSGKIGFHFLLAYFPYLISNSLKSSSRGSSS